MLLTCYIKMQRCLCRQMSADTALKTIPQQQMIHSSLSGLSEVAE